RRHTRFSRDWSSDVCSSDLASGSGARPSCSTANSTFLHCMTLHSARLTLDACPVRLLSIRFGAIPRCFAVKSHTPLNCTHCSSIIVRRLRFCRMPFLPGLLAYLFL